MHSQAEPFMLCRIMNRVVGVCTLCKHLVDASHMSVVKMENEI